MCQVTTHGSAKHTHQRKRRDLENMSLHWTLTHPSVSFFTPTAQLSGMNVIASRSLEPVRGIEVMDREGNVIGYSRKAGTKVGDARLGPVSCLPLGQRI